MVPVLMYRTLLLYRTPLPVSYVRKYDEISPNYAADPGSGRPTGADISMSNITNETVLLHLAAT